MNDFPGVKIPIRSKVCTWIVNQLVWKLFHGVFAKKRFYSFLHLLRGDREEARTILGQRLSINPHRSVVELRLSLCRIYEPAVVSHLSSRLSTGMVMVDIGSNIGFFTLLAADLVGPSGRVLSCEPNPGTFKQLRENISLNGYGNITPVQWAVSSASGTVPLSDLEESSRNSIAVLPREPTVDVPAKTLDQTLEDLGMTRCDFVKMDIEGAEILAIQGMGDTIEKNPHLEFLIEIHERRIQRLGGTPEQLFRFFADKGFRLYELNMWRGLTPMTPSSAHRLKGHLVCRRESSPSRWA